VGIGDGGIVTDAAPPTPVVCNTTVQGGTMSATNWTLAGSPYCVESGVRVSLLTIEAGVQIFMDGDFPIEILTSLTAIGTEAQPILFSAKSPWAPDNQRWQGLKFQDVGPGSNLSYATIEYADASGLTLTNSAAPTLDHCVFRYNSTAKSGGAISATGVLSNVTLTDCTFSQNSATTNGGALSIALGKGFSLTLEGCDFENNTANPAHAGGEFMGGALYFSAGDAVISNCVFRGNRANSQCSGTFDCSVTARGGALWLGGTSATVTRNLFVNNQVDALNQGDCFFGGFSKSQGAAIYVNAGTVTSKNDILGCNTATATACGPALAGDGIYVAGGVVSVTNDTIARNSSTGLQWAAGKLTVRNSLVYSNNSNGIQVGGAGAPPDGGVPSTTIAYSDVQGGYTGEGNISFNPAFSGVTCDTADLALLTGSPAIDTGDSDSALNDGCSPPGLGTARNDMGAFGGPANCGWQ
jgi:predicted outer membrane repeat protein